MRITFREFDPPVYSETQNWLFSDTPKGAEANATVYTMVEMSRAHGLNIYKYLKHLLERLPSTKTTNIALSQLAPWNQDVIASYSGAIQQQYLHPQI